MHFLTNRFGDQYLPEINHYTFNQSGATAVFRKTYGKSFSHPDTFYLMAGTDSGLLIKYIMENEIPPGSRFLFVELPEVLELLPQAIKESDERLVVCTIDEWQKCAKQMSIDGYLFIGKVKEYRSLAVLDAHYPGYLELDTRLSMESSRLRFQANSSLGSKIFVQRQLETLADNLVPARTLLGTASGKSCLLLAGGPSLDEILPWARENRERFVIIAVSRIARRLQQEEITPDIWCSIDPWAANLEVSREMLANEEESLLVHANHIYSPIIGQWAGKSLYLGNRFPWQSPLNGENIPVGAVQVTNSAFSLAIEMDFARIILGGVDFCYHKDGHTHASGSLDWEKGPLTIPADTHIQTYDGYTAETDFPLATAATAFDTLAATAREKGIDVVNPAAGAARLEHVRHLPLDAIPLPEPLGSFRKSLYKKVPEPNAIDFSARQQEALLELSRMLGELKEIHRLSIKALKCHTAMCSPDLDIQAKAGQKLRMDRIERQLRNRYTAASRLIKEYGIHSFLQMGIVDRDRTWEEEDIERVGRIYYQSYRDTAGELIKLVSATRRRLLSRIDEQSEHPDFPALFRQWENDQQPGRARVWRKRYSDRYARLPDTIAERFRSLEESFHHQLQHTGEIKGFTDGTSYQDRLEQRQQDLIGLFGRLNRLFERRETAGIKKLLTGLEQNPSEQAQQLATIARGYLAELQGEPDHAMEQYLRIVEKEAVPQVLARISALSLERQDYATATLALEVLAELSPLFMPSYANILRLTGEQAKALEVYHRYLNQMPDDLATVIAVGKFYLELDARQAAADAFNYVLKRDPGNSAAHTLLHQASMEPQGEMLT